MSRRACLAEDWFASDQIESLDGLCDTCRAAWCTRVLRHGDTLEDAFRGIYKLSRAVRVTRMLNGMDDPGPDDGLEFMRVIGTLDYLTHIAISVHARRGHVPSNLIGA